MIDTTKTPKQQYKEAEEKMLKALRACTPDKAEKTIGRPEPETYQTIMSGVEGANHMVLWLAESNGARRSKRTHQQFSQHWMVMLQIVNFAYALGIEEGKRRANESIAKS